jgi:tetratricopeptide (TPR) repeat protein
MPYNLIAIIIILFCIVAVLYIIFRKFPKLAMIDISTIQKERDAQVKEKILEQRLDRYFRSILHRFSPLLKGVSMRLQKRFKVLYRQLLIWEQKYEKLHSRNEQVVSDKLLLAREEAEELLSSGRWKEAEEKYIDMVKVDPKNRDAYSGLTQVYKGLKDYEKARETALYVLKLLKDDPEQASIYVDIGQMYLFEGDRDHALEHFQKAVALEGNNPRYLDFLLDLAIILENRDLAVQTYEQFHSVNPENQRLAEYKDRIGKLIVKKSMEERAAQPRDVRR